VSDETAPKTPQTLTEELRGALRLAVDATKQVTGIVEDMHRTIGGGPALLGKPLAPFVALFSAPVEKSIRGIAGMVGVGLDFVLRGLAPVLDGSRPASEFETVRAALNGVLGDHLAASANPLAIPLELRSQGRALSLTREALAADLPSATGKIVVLLHGSSMDDASFLRRGHNHGEALARDLGVTPVFVRYNSGLHVSTNGSALSELLGEMVAAWPCKVEALGLLGFSMGGLVARAALHADEIPRRWRAPLVGLATLGTPHHGAPLERVGNLLGVLMDANRYSAPLARLAKLRSAGVTDLRYGNVLAEHWEGRDRFAPAGDPRVFCSLPEALPCLAIAATLSTDLPASPDAAPHIEKLSSDGLVPVASALGRHPDPARDLGIPGACQRVIPGSTHVDLLNSPEAYEALRAWFAGLLSPAGTA
jgi:hypothetical protein